MTSDDAREILSVSVDYADKEDYFLLGLLLVVCTQKSILKKKKSHFEQTENKNVVDFNLLSVCLRTLYREHEIIFKKKYSVTYPRNVY